MRRSMPFRPRDETQEKAIEQYMEENGLIQSEAMRTLIDKALNMENRFAFLDAQPCQLRDYLGKTEAPPKIGEGWFCMEKAPRLTKLGSGIESAASKICGKCIIREGALEDSRILKEERTKGRVIFYPNCKKGGKVNDTLDEMYCPEIGGRRPIKERKKKKDPQPCHAKGMKPYKRCPNIEWTQLVVKGKLPDGQNL